ncbi:MAG TPA: DNA-binding response regulator [Deltaproteobacteria bacterium]|nr:MAG: hypothetical protein A2Z79_11540 [Deltaproteobacteria bacterium GWA2_55_82]OGQ63502.1 MAG: hypothetical protein A3I81_05725 [Deltaproteobacteria bacterium RIFCSPLOWO2_02_FULL_55_12]OIJ74883.1 MAG: hypothetical protein A2V21_311785 [Deltaproteobacteria bacterium GWC2_55_46]HBG47465.1 DNA-binding response regulator [Deltaproteobacteria bacterium]HCY11481.1 DNA-binding response regulator [Deltaproteobacteria bacterium]
MSDRKNLIFIVDDNKDMRLILSDVLRSEGYEVCVCSSPKTCLKEFETMRPSLVLLDFKLPEMDGLELLKELKARDEDLMVVMLTAYGEIKSAVQAMKLGAFDYVTKPFNNEELVLIIRNALKTGSLAREVASLKTRLEQCRPYPEGVMSDSPQFRQVLNQVFLIAPTDVTVILQGESGTGKELLARMIHDNSSRRNKPFVAIDCGALPETLAESELFGYEKGAFSGADARKEGQFELANGGTLFLDEITNLSESVQSKLLRVLQDRKVHLLGGKRDFELDVRIMAATNVDFLSEVNAGRFRNDLYHRLNEFNIHIPALRDRGEDVPALASYFLGLAAKEFRKEVKEFSCEAMEVLLNYNWPGNIRELRNAIRRAALLEGSDQITPAALPPEIVKKTMSLECKELLGTGTSLNKITRTLSRNVERDIISKALSETKNNKTRAAKMLGIDRMTLYSKMKLLGLG